LIAKFLIKRNRFWEKGFAAIPKSALFPTRDRVKDICEQIKTDLDTEIEPGRLGKFLQEWTDLENLVLSFARQRKDKVYSTREAISILARAEMLSLDMQDRLNDLRRFRNLAVHEPRKLKPQDLAAAFEEVAILKSQLRKFPS